MNARGWLAAATLALLPACASLQTIPRDGSVAPPLPADVRDLRGEYRATLCARAEMAGGRCERTLQRLAGEARARPAPPAEASALRLLFVPGFLSNCLPAYNTFGDAMSAGVAGGFDVARVDIAGRASVAANAATLAHELEALPRDGRRLVVVAHSKGAVDVLELLAARPDLAAGVAALLTIAAPLSGSPLAETFAGVYALAVASNPLLACPPGNGNELADLTPQARERWWREHGGKVRVPVYSLVALPDGDRVSPVFLVPHAMLARTDPLNDGEIPARSQVAPSGILLGYVNADHLESAIPRSRQFPWTLALAFADVPRASIVLAAVDVIAADLARAEDRQRR